MPTLRRVFVSKEARRKDEDAPANLTLPQCQVLTGLARPPASVPKADAPGVLSEEGGHEGRVATQTPGSGPAGLRAAGRGARRVPQCATASEHWHDH